MTRLPKLPLALMFAALALTAGCNKAGDKRASTSEVVEGTISDEMIPVDTLTSEPPIAEPTDSGKDASAKPKAKGKNAKSASDGAADSADAAALADSVTPAPATPG